MANKISDFLKLKVRLFDPASKETVEEFLHDVYDSVLVNRLTRDEFARIIAMYGVLCRN